MESNIDEKTNNFRKEDNLHMNNSDTRLSSYQCKRIGEKRRNNQGIFMEVVAYRGARDIDVRFETGEVVTRKEYGSFDKGEISCPSGYSYMHVGEKRKNNQGIGMEIISCRDPMHLDIRFETGETVENRSYARFKSGLIGCPSSRKLKRIGEKNINNQGVGMSIIEYRGRKDIEVEFETGDVVHTSYGQFKKGATRCPSFRKGKGSEKREAARQ